MSGHSVTFRVQVCASITRQVDITFSAAEIMEAANSGQPILLERAKAESRAAFLAEFGYTEGQFDNIEAVYFERLTPPDVGG